MTLTLTVMITKICGTIGASKVKHE